LRARVQKTANRRPVEDRVFNHVSISSGVRCPLCAGPAVLLSAWGVLSADGDYSSFTYRCRKCKTIWASS